MAERADAELDQVAIGQVGHDIEVNRVGRESRGVLAQPELVEPGFELCRHASLFTDAQSPDTIAQATSMTYRVLTRFFRPAAPGLPRPSTSPDISR